jgi:hypothetical protein
MQSTFSFLTESPSVSANDVVKMRLLGAFLFIHTQKLTQKIPVAFVACGFYFCFGK